jgi:hypothetical protein
MEHSHHKLGKFEILQVFLFVSCWLYCVCRSPIVLKIQYRWRKNNQISFAYKFVKFRSKSGKFKTSYSHEKVRLDADVNFDLSPTINASAVVGYQGWLGGYQLAFDTKKSALTKNNFALGYTAGDLVIHTNV